MTATTTVIVAAGQGGRDLLRTADALRGQDPRPLDIIVVAPASRAVPLLASVVARLDARVVEADDEAAGVNAAAAGSASDNVVLVPAGFGLRPSCLARCASVLSESSLVSAVAPSVFVHTPDAVRGTVHTPCGPDEPAILADPLAAPRVLMIRRAMWNAIGGYDETLSGLGELDLWLRLASAPQSLRILNDALVTHPLAPGSRTDEPAFLSAFRTIVEKHREAIEQRLVEVFVAQEARFGRLRATHAALTTDRDRDLAELDRLRAAAAHGRAFLSHHALGEFDWGDLRRTDPLSRDWGYERGGPVDRRDIESFLAAHSSDIHGAVLEVQEDDFTRTFGGPRVMSSDVLDIDAGNPRATVIADLRCAPELPDDRYDAIILTQTLHVIDDMTAALRECHRALRPGGVLLATMPAASRVCLEYGEDGDLWRATPAGARALASPVFGAANVECDVFGNVLTNTAFLHGVGVNELTDGEYDTTDPYFPALTGIRARKAAGPVGATSTVRGTVLLYHRIDDRDDAHGLAVPEAAFAQHLAWLSANCSVIGLDRMLSMPIESLPERAVAVTFDDGYLDTLVRGVPLLERHRVPATFFLTTRWLGEPGEYWWDLLERALLRGGAMPPYIELPMGGAAQRLPTSTPEQRAAAHWRLHAWMVHAPLDERDRACAAIRAWSGGAALCRPMVADEVHELARAEGVTIGAHGVNHLALPDQPSEVQRREVVDSAAVLSDLLGRPVNLFAHPYGAIDRRSASIVRASCRWGVSCEERAVRASFDAARAPRLDVKRWTAEELAARMGQLAGW